MDGWGNNALLAEIDLLGLLIFIPFITGLRDAVEESIHSNFPEMLLILFVGVDFTLLTDRFRPFSGARIQRRVVAIDVVVMTAFLRLSTVVELETQIVTQFTLSATGGRRADSVSSSLFYRRE